MLKLILFIKSLFFNNKAKNNFRNFLKICIIFLMITSWMFSGWPQIWQNPQIPPKIQEAQATTRTIEQQINIIDQEYSNNTTNYLPDGNDLGSLGIIKFDPDKYNAETLYFEALLAVNSGIYTRVRSNSFSVPASAQQYTVRLKAGLDGSCESEGTVAFVQLYSITSSSEVTSIFGGCGTPGGTAHIKAARLIIVQTDGTSITNTETQIEIGNNENITIGSYGSLTDKKIYLYDHDKFDPAPTAYFEATLKSSPTYGEATYYFSGHDASEKWPTTPENMVDSNTGTWAKAGNSSVTQLNTSNTCDATCAARSETITKVELRIHACAESGDNPNITLRPVFPGSLDGNDHPYTPNAVCASNDGSNAYWSSDFNITNDDNAPSPWTWGAIQTLDCDVFFERVGGPDFGYATRVEIIVTYESDVGTAYARLYNKTNGTVVSNSEVSVNSTSWTLIRGSNALSTNWDTVSDDEYYVEIKNSSGTTAYIANAKIILTQTDTGGIDKFETVHQYVNTADGSPGLSGSPTYARLAVAGGAEVTDSTVSTTSDSYDRQRTASSISLTNNNYDTEVKGGGDPSYTQTDFDNKYTSTNWVGGIFSYYFEATIARPRPAFEISNSWLIIQVSGLTGATFSDSATAYSFQRKTWYDGSRYWKAFNNGSAIEFWYSTDDGASWNQNTSATISVDTNDFSIEVCSSDLFIVYTDSYSVKANEDNNNYPAINFTWGGSPTTVYTGSGATDEYDYPAITKDTSNKIWITAVHHSSSDYIFKAMQSTNANDVSAWETASSLDTSTNSNKYGTIVPLLTNNMYATWIDDATIEGKKYTSGLDGGYSYHKKITISHSAGTGAGTNYQVKLLIGKTSDAVGENFDLNTHCLDTFYDIRFTDNDKTTELNYWIESVVDSNGTKLATVWVKVTDSLENTNNVDIYIYYGKTGDSDGSAGINTFLFFDDFNAGTVPDTDKWNSAGTPLVSSGALHLNDDDAILGKTSFGYNHAIITKAKADEQSICFVAFADSIGYISSNQLTINNAAEDDPDDFDKICSCATKTGIGTCTGVDANDFRNTYFNYEIKRIDGQADFYQGNTFLLSHTNVLRLPVIDLYPKVNVWDDFQESTLDVDWILVRKYATTTPAYISNTAEQANLWSVSADTVAAGKTGMSNNMSAVSDSSGYVHLAYIDPNSKAKYIKYTGDGTAWTAQTPDDSYSNTFYGIAHDGSGLWTAVGSSGEIQTSPNGTDWTAQTPDGFPIFFGIAHDGSGLWTAVGNSGKIQTSPNGTDWTAQTSAGGFTGIFYGIAHDGSGLWTAVGSSGEIQTSPNGTDWTAQTPDGGFNSYFHGIAHDGSGLWTAVGAESEIQTSPNGADWTAQTPAASATFQGIAHNGSGLWTAVGTSGKIQTSPNGTDWTAQTPDDSYTGIFYGIAHDGSGLWTAVGSSGEIQTSPDGITWTAQTPDDSYTGIFYGIAHDGSGLWTAVGSSGEIQTRLESWRSIVELDTATCEYASMAIDTRTNGGIYAFWIRNNDVFYKKGCSPWASSDWETTQTLESSGTNDWVVAGYKDFEPGHIIAQWTQGSAPPYSIKWDLFEPTVCTAADPTLTFAIPGDNAITFGDLNTASPRWAGDSAGSESESSAHTLTASTNSSSGYSITVKGDTLKDGGNSITAIGDTPTSVASGGAKQFGIRITSSGNACAGSQVTPYNGAANMYGYNATATTNDEIISCSSASGTTTYSMYYAGNIAGDTNQGDYSANLIYICTGNF